MIINHCGHDKMWLVVLCPEEPFDVNIVTRSQIEIPFEEKVFA